MSMNQTKPSPSFSKTYSANNFLFISGQIGTDPSTGKLANSDFETEAHQVMKNIGVLLGENELAFKDLVSVTIYLKKMSDYQRTNEIYSSYFQATLPSRTCVGVAYLPANASIEISAIAKVN